MGFKVIDSSITGVYPGGTVQRPRLWDTLLCDLVRSSLLLSGISIVAQTTADHQAVFLQLGREADQFERSAHRVVGRERLKQTVPDGVRMGTGMRGIETRLPGYTREMISQYGFVSMDEPGGAIQRSAPRPRG